MSMVIHSDSLGGKIVWSNLISSPLRSWAGSVFGWETVKEGVGEEGNGKLPSLPWKPLAEVASSWLWLDGTYKTSLQFFRMGVCLIQCPVFCLSCTYHINFTGWLQVLLLWVTENKVWPFNTWVSVIRWAPDCSPCALPYGHIWQAARERKTRAKKTCSRCSLFVVEHSWTTNMARGVIQECS